MEAVCAAGCVAFLRGLNAFFAYFFRVFGCRKRRDLPQGAAIEFSFFPIKKQRQFWWACQAPIVYAMIATATLSPLCVYRIYRPWVRSAVSDKSTCSGLSAGIRRGTPQPILGVGQQVDETRGHWAVHLGQPRRASLFLGTEGARRNPHGILLGYRRCPNGMPWTRGRLQRHSGAPRLWLVIFSGCGNKGDNGLNSFHE